MTGAAPDGELSTLHAELAEMGFRPLGRSWEPLPVYPYERLMEEAAYLAYYLHWPVEQVLQLEHADRRAWAAETSRINQEINEESGSLTTL